MPEVSVLAQFDKFFPGKNGFCPHCGVNVRFVTFTLVQRNSNRVTQGGMNAADGEIVPADCDTPSLTFAACPSCRLPIIQLKSEPDEEPRLVFPRTGSRRPVHESVPTDLLSDYHESVVVLEDSPKASAALSRRCLQHLLIKKGANKKKQLRDQLDELHASLPAYVQSYVDSIRKLGNIAAHPKTDANTDRILDVEPGEADWMLELLEELFDHYYAKPAESRKRQDALVKKLANAANPQASS